MKEFIYLTGEINECLFSLLKLFYSVVGGVEGRLVEAGNNNESYPPMETRPKGNNRYDGTNQRTVFSA